MPDQCQFCERPLGASKQKGRHFCSNTCRSNFHTGCRKLGEDLFRTGAVNSAVIRMHARKTNND